MRLLQRIAQALRDSAYAEGITAACGTGSHFNCSGSVYAIPWTRVCPCRCACHAGVLSNGTTEEGG